MKKIFMSPLFMPIVFMIVWLSFMVGVYYLYPNDVLNITEEGGVVEDITHFGYVVLIAVLLMCSDTFADRVKTWATMFFLAMCAFLREQGIQHHLSQTDTTPFKSRFFLNPNNPISEKIIFGTVLLIVAGAVIYLAIKYSKHLVRSFFQFNPVTWSIAVLCTVGVCAKLVDRFPSNWKKAHNGVPLPEQTYAICQLLEESSEMFLLYIAVGALYQFKLQKQGWNA